jgi:ribosome biogenesis GTPase / thiamine phosphate phosphatase
MLDRLTALGWTAHRAQEFEPLAADGLEPGRVVLEHTHLYRVVTAAGDFLARVSGRLRHRAGARPDFPAVGDWVGVKRESHQSSGRTPEPPNSRTPEPRIGDPQAEGRIHAVLPRTSRFSRRAAGNATEEQIVAANIDTVFLVAGLDGDFNPRRIERYLLVARESGARPVIVLNKADLVEDPQARAADVAAAAPDVPVHVVSCRQSETLDVLRTYLGSGQTGALLGSSGVGKSTIVNRLIGQDLLRTRDVRESDSRGRHTSTARQLVQLPGSGVLIDTPGMREIQLWDVVEDVAGAFGEIDALAGGCRFRDCRHRGEPGCAVRAAVDAGTLSAGRLENFHKLVDEQAHHARQLDQRAEMDEKRRTKMMTKALHKRLREKDR